MTEGTAPVLRLRILGLPEVVLGDRPVRLRRRVAVAVLAYLAVTGRPQPRRRLAALVAGDADPQHADRRLSNALAELRGVLGGPAGPLRTDHEWVALDPAHPLWLDVSALRAAAAAAAAGDLAAAGAAEGLYRDEFLAGLDLPDAPAFDEWLLVQREHARGTLTHALQGGLDGLVRRGATADTGDAAALARRLLILEPWREEAHRALMVLLGRAGQRARRPGPVRDLPAGAGGGARGRPRGADARPAPDAAGRPGANPAQPAGAPGRSGGPGGGAGAAGRPPGRPRLPPGDADRPGWDRQNFASPSRRPPASSARAPLSSPSSRTASSSSRSPGPPKQPRWTGRAGPAAPRPPLPEGPGWPPGPEWPPAPASARPCGAPSAAPERPTAARRPHGRGALAQLRSRRLLLLLDGLDDDATAAAARGRAASTPAARTGPDAAGHRPGPTPDRGRDPAGCAGAPPPHRPGGRGGEPGRGLFPAGGGDPDRRAAGGRRRPRAAAAVCRAVDGAAAGARPGRGVPAGDALPRAGRRAAAGARPRRLDGGSAAGAGALRAEIDALHGLLRWRAEDATGTLARARAGPVPAPRGPAPPPGPGGHLLRPGRRRGRGPGGGRAPAPGPPGGDAGAGEHLLPAGAHHRGPRAPRQRGAAGGGARGAGAARSARRRRARRPAAAGGRSSWVWSTTSGTTSRRAEAHFSSTLARRHVLPFLVVREATLGLALTLHALGRRREAAEAAAALVAALRRTGSPDQLAVARAGEVL